MTRFYTQNDVRAQEFYQLPKDLILNPKYDDLSPNAKIAYAILKDRHSLSLKNQWIDNIGVYFLLSDNELAEILRTTPRSAGRYKNDLRKFDLIHMERQGLNRRNKIYLLKPEFDESELEADRTILSTPDRTKLSNQDTTKLSSQDRTNLSTYSKNDFSKNDFSNKEDEEDMLLSNLIDFYSKNISQAGKETISTKLKDWLHIMPYSVVQAVLENCALYGAKSWAYVEKALKDAKGVNSVEELNQKHDQHKRKQAKPRNRRTPIRKEVVPDYLNEESKNNEFSEEEEEKRKRLLLIQQKYKGTVS